MIRIVGLWCGIVSPILWLGLIAMAGATRPDFSHITHYISELGERGSATETLVRYGAFGFTGFLYLGFAGALRATVREGWLSGAVALLIAVEGIGRMGAGVFPCDPGCVPISTGPNIHTLFATIGFSSGILAALACGALARRVPRLRPIAGFSVACGAVALVSLVWMVRSEGSTVPAGLLEHLATVVLSVWLLVLACRLVWTDRLSSQPHAET